VYSDLTNYENIIIALALVLVIIFALAAFLDNRWRKAERLRNFGSDLKPFIPPESDEQRQDERSLRT
jgi:hypothetical protein